MQSPRFDDPTLSVGDLMVAWPEVLPVFMRNRMLCVGCAVSPFHTIEEVCALYGIETDAFLKELEEAINSPRQPR